jgi:hypothetical protein
MAPEQARGRTVDRRTDIWAELLLSLVQGLKNAISIPAVAEGEDVNAFAAATTVIQRRSMV